APVSLTLHDALPVLSAGVRRPEATAEPSAILILTSRSEEFTPAELSMKSVLIRPPWRANSIRPDCVTPRLAPSPMTFARTSRPRSEEHTSELQSREK